MTESDEIIQLQLIKVGQGTTEDYLEMPLKLIEKVVSENMTISVPHGNNYTLLPFDDIQLMVLKETYRVFKLLDEPTRYQYVLQQRQDSLVKAIEDMFGYNMFKQIDSEAELAGLIAHHYGAKNKYIPRVVKRPRLGDLFAKLSGQETPLDAEPPGQLI